MACHGCIQVLDIARMMFVVMQMHCLGVNVRFERIVGVRKRRQLEGPSGERGGGH
jgi:hypothetical protein